MTLGGIPNLLYAAEPRRGGTLRVSVSRELKSLNPFKHVNLSEYMQGELMYSGLVKISKDLQPVPDVAESWESPDATTWFFKLRKGVQFQNGKELTSEDVVASIQKILQPETASPVGRTSVPSGKSGPTTSTPSGSLRNTPSPSCLSLWLIPA